jgi:hypothetical protein
MKLSGDGMQEVMVLITLFYLGLLLVLMDLVIMAIHVILSLLDQLIVNSPQTGGFFPQEFQIFNR